MNNIKYIIILLAFVSIACSNQKSSQKSTDMQIIESVIRFNNQSIELDQEGAALKIFYTKWHERERIFIKKLNEQQLKAYIDFKVALNKGEQSQVLLVSKKLTRLLYPNTDRFETEEALAISEIEFAKTVGELDKLMSDFSMLDKRLKTLNKKIVQYNKNRAMLKNYAEIVFTQQQIQAAQARTDRLEFQKKIDDMNRRSDDARRREQDDRRLYQLQNSLDNIENSLRNKSR